MKNKRSINKKMWLYLSLFSILIVSFIWIFQVTFLKQFYEWGKTNELKIISNKILENNITDIKDLELLAHDYSVCIEIDKNNTNIYNTSQFNKGCLVNANNDLYKNKFINSDEKVKAYKLINQRYNNQTLIYGIKLDNDIFMYLSASLVPLDSTLGIFTYQFIFVTIFVLILSFVVAYYISLKLSKPIVDLNTSASLMAQGNYNIIFNDTSEILEISTLSSTLNYTTGKLAKSDELRRELMANVSHDLKTPLTMIKAYAEAARDLNYDNLSKRTNNLDIIIEETDRLNLLVNDILDLTKLEANVLKNDDELINLNLLISTILNKFNYLVEDGYKFIYNPSIIYYVMFDKKRLEQVLYNLINNAVNYTGPNKDVYINLINKGNYVLIEIRDTGKGIDDDEINLIWDKYYKSDKKYKRNKIGNGIGLSIVKNIFINNDVEYGVKTKKDKGTTFYFKLLKTKEK